MAKPPIIRDAGSTSQYPRLAIQQFRRRQPIPSLRDVSKPIFENLSMANMEKEWRLSRISGK